MFARIVLFLLMGVGLAGFGVVAWINLHPAAAPPLAEAATANDNVPLLIAAKPLRAGTLLKPEDLAVEQRSAKDVPAGGQIDTEAVRSELLGALIRRNLTKGEAVLSADVLNPGDRGFLAAVLGSGMRAVTVGVDAVTGLAGLVWPGDRVDLILTQSQEGSDVPPARRVSAETVLHDVRVLAIDRQLIQGATSESPESQTVRTVTLEVTPADAERVVVGAKLGHLSLSVVAFAQTTGMPAAIAGTEGAAPSLRSGSGITWGGDVSSALRGGGTRVDGPTVRLFRGASESKEIHF
jgi:pilus assembly protein CpaB